VGVKTGFLPRTVSILVKSSTTFLGCTGDDGGDLAGWLGLDQIISELDNLGDPIMIIVKGNAGSRKDFRMATSSVNLMVRYWFRSLSVYLRSVACSTLVNSWLRTSMFCL
jgi:hypothetical protein